MQPLNYCHHPMVAPDKIMAVSIRWTGLLDWTTGLDYWTGLLDSRIKLVPDIFTVDPDIRIQYPIILLAIWNTMTVTCRWRRRSICRVGSTTDRAKPVNPCFSGAMELYRSAPLLGTAIEGLSGELVKELRKSYVAQCLELTTAESRWPEILVGSVDHVRWRSPLPKIIVW